MDTLNHDLTPRMSAHALERARQMGLTAKVAKAIWRHPAIVWPCRTREGQEVANRRYHVTSDRHPEYGIVVCIPQDGHPVVVTILFWTGDGTGRDRTEYLDRQEASA